MSLPQVITTPFNVSDKPVQPLQEGLARNSATFRLVSQGFRGDTVPINCTSPPNCNLPFDSATMSPTRPAPRLATKMMAPVIRYLRSCSLRIPIYIDDLILLCRSYEESIAHTQLLVDTLHKLGFGIHPEKAQMIPSR